MVTEDKWRFAGLVRTLQSAYGGRKSDSEHRAQCRAYWAVLEPFALPLVEKGFTEAIRRHQRFRPTPSQIAEVCRDIARRDAPELPKSCEGEPNFETLTPEVKKMIYDILGGVTVNERKL